MSEIEQCELLYVLVKKFYYMEYNAFKGGKDRYSYFLNSRSIDMKRLLVTGAAGFIGSNVCRLLASEENYVVGIDNMNSYYDLDLKQYRLRHLQALPNFTFRKLDISNKEAMMAVMEEFRPTVVIHLAAQAGVRYSIDCPDAYMHSNMTGFFNILEACRYGKDYVEKLVFASSSSVYGANTKVPYAESDPVDQPVSFYAATKKSNELMAFAYAKLYKIPTIGLRFFTVYGPAGRPDMAYYKFTNRLINKEKIRLYNYGHCKRDFTYIDDISKGIALAVKGSVPVQDVPYEIYNLGNHQPVDLLEFVQTLISLLVEHHLVEKEEVDSLIELAPMQPGDVVETYADMTKFANQYHYRPHTELKDGLRCFMEWYIDYYGLHK